MSDTRRVLIAGIGGASLGTEILKCLRLVGGYEVFGCDISPHAFGHYQAGFAETFLVARDGYVDAVEELCVRHGIAAVIPGGEGPLGLLGPQAERFAAAGVHVAANSPDVVATCSDKARLFERLAALGVPMPRTVTVRDASQCGEVGYPCVVKPATGTGGSRFVFLAADRAEAELYAAFVLNNADAVLIQEYVPHDEGEFTVGVLSTPAGRLVGSVAMRRLFHAKLSVQFETAAGLISSGYSQGLIDEFPEVRSQSEAIARAIGSAGPVNIQARLRGGRLLPFEINPRFSASTYLRALAGFNEIDIYLRHVLDGRPLPAVAVRPGYYLRSLDELAVPLDEVKR